MSPPSQIEEQTPLANCPHAYKGWCLDCVQKLTATHASQTSEHDKQVAELTRKLEEALRSPAGYEEELARCDELLAEFKASGDMYGVNFHEGRQSGIITGDIIQTEEKKQLRAQLAESQAARLAAEEKVEELSEQMSDIKSQARDELAAKDLDIASRDARILALEQVLINIAPHVCSLTCQSVKLTKEPWTHSAECLAVTELLRTPNLDRSETMKDDLEQLLQEAEFKTVSGADNVLEAIAQQSDGSTDRLCSGFRVFPDGTKCDGCPDCKQARIEAMEEALRSIESDEKKAMIS
jgi:hypothetical protein